MTALESSSQVRSGVPPLEVDLGLEPVGSRPAAADPAHSDGTGILYSDGEAQTGHVVVAVDEVFELLHGTSDGPWLRWLGQYPSAGTRDSYRRGLLDWLGWLASHGRRPEDARPSDTHAWMADLRGRGMAPATVAQRVRAVASYYRWARREGLTTADPSPDRPPRVHSDPTRRLGLPADQLAKLLTAARPGLERALVAVLGYTGVRVSEATGADVSDVREVLGRRVLQVLGKGEKPRTPPIPDPVWAALVAYLEDRQDGPLFLSKRGHRLARQRAWEIVREIGQRVGIRVHPHLFRHTAAVLMVRAGFSIPQIADALGHADIKTTMTYLHGLLLIEDSPIYGLADLIDGALAEAMGQDTDTVPDTAAGEERTA